MGIQPQGNSLSGQEVLARYPEGNVYLTPALVAALAQTGAYDTSALPELNRITGEEGTGLYFSFPGDRGLQLNFQKATFAGSATEQILLAGLVGQAQLAVAYELEGAADRWYHGISSTEFFVAQDTGSVEYKLRLNANGQLTLPNYGSNTFAGTPVRYLGVDALGQVVEAASSGSGVPEAPIDGTPYSRQDASWVPSIKVTVGTTAPPSPSVGDIWVDTN